MFAKAQFKAKREHTHAVGVCSLILLLWSSF